MKIFIISPNTETQLTQEHRSALEAAGDVVIFNEIKPFDQLTELYEGDEPRIVAVDPGLQGLQGLQGFTPRKQRYYIIILR